MMGSSWVVVMGVCGSGKSTVGRQLAQQLGVEFLEGDELHPLENVARMAAGVPLTDADRQDWLHAVAAMLGMARMQGRGLVVSCSALKRQYRDILRGGAPGLQLVYLHGERQLLARRMASRADHYMPASLLESQFAALEEPGADERSLAVDVDQPLDAVVSAIAAQLNAQPEPKAPT